MTQFLQQVVSGLASGGIFASLALALVLIYRATRVINFAQGEMATVSTFVAWSLVHHGMPFWGAFFLTLALSFLGGVALERVVIRPVESAPVLTIVIVTLGLAILLNGFTSVEWGSDVKKFPSPFPTRPIHAGGVAFSIQDLGVIAVSIALVLALGAFFRFTKLGLALRAAALNPEASRLVGVRVSWMLALGWGLAAVLGAVSGMMIAPVVFLDPNMMQTVLLYALAAAILGGMDSPVGAVVGGLALGVILNLTGAYVSFIGGTLRLPVALAVILLVLVVRPSGLFGRAAVRKV
ncbi:MAG: branched-chain amino acid transport system permease protein [Gaiellaceae bacterium]|nr:branched-chain amino acid transport system permease protein [Gaiellaceae bacterium]MDX6488850.1 branched-chain amino acid transport system permease protein [Gaiellaceae bacterium]MDX6492831.1 branched-chain amino acid transport system permease protein [Gaiellaceae bacterium]